MCDDQRFEIRKNSINRLYLIFNNVNGYFEEINRNLTLVPTNENKEKIKNI